MAVRQRSSASYVVILFALSWSVGAPVSAQDLPTGPARSVIGQAGQRQTREQVAPNSEPMERIDSRVANRVQSRFRNRIDRFYNPQSNAAAPFQIAGEQARAAGPSWRR